MALGFAEIPFFSITAVIADRAVKAAPVRILGIEATGDVSLLLRLEGDLSAVESALEASPAAGALPLGGGVLGQLPPNHGAFPACEDCAGGIDRPQIQK